MKRIIFLSAIVFSINAFAQISNDYPNDAGIESDSRVLFVEKFNDGLTNITGRYDEVLNEQEFFLDTDVPAGSAETFSLKISNTEGVNSGGHLYKSFSPGFEESVFIRYYVKYPSIPDGYIGHQGVWFGGYNPIIPYPYPRAGYCGLGDGRLSIAFENVWQGNPPGLDTYLYWGDMRSYDGGYTCFGNPMITQGKTDFDQPAGPDAPVTDLDEWMCIEMMIKLNNPVTAYNGELKVWKNGVEVGYWGPGFPNGHWFKDKWYNNPDDPPFEGFRWRTDENLNINWIWIEYYHTSAPESYIKFSNIVMAKEYIGPIWDPVSSVKDAGLGKLKVFPNPAGELIRVSCDEKINTLKIFDLTGHEIKERKQGKEIDVADLKNGIYFLVIETQKNRYNQKIVKSGRSDDIR